MCSEQEIEKPVSALENPETLVADNPETPATENPEVPVAENPEAPAIENAEAPVAENPEAPVAENPEAPVADNSEAPAIENPEAPVTENAEAPVTENAKASVAENPEAPVADNSEALVIENAEAPVTENPAAPVAENPEAPATENAEPPVAEELKEEPWNAVEQITCPKDSILEKARWSERSVREWIHTYGDKFEQFEFAFNFFAGQNRVHFVHDVAEIPSDLWFIGDVHGDILALENALSFIDARTPDATIVFLGDLFDRFEYGIEVVMRVIALIKERPGRILWIAGNHDDGLLYENGRFGSKVLPSEFCNFLNEHKEYEDFGKWLIDFCKMLPRALFLPDGLFVAHGGCPAFDMNTFAHSIDDVNQLEELEDDKYLHSFIWNRIIPDQDDKSEPEVGKNDLLHFMERMEKLSGIPVKRMLRGHDHCKENRHEFFESYYPQAPVLTLTTMSAWYLGNEDFPPERMVQLRKAPITTPAIAQYRHGQLPKVFTLDIPKSLVRQFHKVEDLPNEVQDK